MVDGDNAIVKVAAIEGFLGGFGLEHLVLLEKDLILF
jgi:hypothetical protein